MNTINHLSTTVTANSSVSAEAIAFSSVSSPIPTTLMDSYSNDHSPSTTTQVTKEDKSPTTNTTTSKSLVTVTPSPANSSNFDVAALTVPTAAPVSTKTSHDTSRAVSTDPPKDDHGEEEGGRITETASAKGTELSTTDKSNSLSSTTSSLACLAKLCSSILTESKKRDQPAFAYEDSLISSAAASSPMASTTTRNKTPKTRPTSLYTDDHPFEMNKLHCYLLKDILELYYVDTSSKIAKKMAVFKPNPNANRVITKSATSNEDGDMTTAVTTTHKRRRTKTAKAMALEEYDDEEEAAEGNVSGKKPGDDVPYEEEDATANDDDATSPPPAKRRKTLTSAKDEPIIDPYVEIGKRKEDMMPLSEATNLCAVRCKFCRKERGTGVIWVKSLTQQHLYVKVAAFYRLHLKDCKHCPPSVLAKFKSLKATQSKRGRKDFWIKSALKQGLVTVVDDMDRAVGIAFKE